MVIGHLRLAHIGFIVNEGVTLVAEFAFAGEAEVSAILSDLSRAALAVESEVALTEFKRGKSEECVVRTIRTADLHGAAIVQFCELRGWLTLGNGIKDGGDGRVRL